MMSRHELIFSLIVKFCQHALYYGAGIALPVAALALFVGLRTRAAAHTRSETRAEKAGDDEAALAHLALSMTDDGPTGAAAWEDEDFAIEKSLTILRK
jgi:hypothetical protein